MLAFWLFYKWNQRLLKNIQIFGMELKTKNKIKTINVGRENDYEKDYGKI